MVKCGRVDGNPCSCELTNPCVNYMVETIISNILKVTLKEISPFERNELQEFVRMPDAGKYIGIYVEELDNHRRAIDSTEPCIDYILETVISGILRLVMKTISPAERDELCKFVQMPSIGMHIRIYIENLDKHREVIGDVVLNTI